MGGWVGTKGEKESQARRFSAEHRVQQGAQQQEGWVAKSWAQSHDRYVDLGQNQVRYSTN